MLTNCGCGSRKDIMFGEGRAPGTTEYLLLGTFLTTLIVLRVTK